MSEDSKIAAAYCPFVTFKNSIEELAQGVPNQIDRSTFAGMSGSVAYQVLAAFKFLALTRDDGTPTASLHAVATPDEGARKEALKNVFKERYADLFALDLTKATPKQLADRMGESYQVSGDTREKAIRFFLAAVQYLGIPISRYIVKQPGAATSSNGSSQRSRRPNKAKAGPILPPAPPPPPATTGGATKEIGLKSGGTLTLIAACDFVALSKEDREFVFALIDKLAGYERDGA